MMSLLAFLFTNLVLEPIHETGMAPVKLYTTRDLPYSRKINVVQWTIIAVSELIMVQMFLFRIVTVYHW